jgi:hypothetical protein
MFPQGYQRREILAVNKPGRKWWNKTQWVWRSGGPRIHAGIETTSTSTCLTYFQCSGCKFYVRPIVQERPRAKQLKKACPSCGAKDCWIHPECSAVTHLWAEGDKLIWEHEGTHNHTKPPQQGRLTEAQREHIKTQIIRRMKATPHELQTGDELPGSLPLGEISPALNDPRKARYTVNLLRAELGVPEATIPKGSLAMFRRLRNFNIDVKEVFLVGSSVHGPGVLLCQTNWMEQVLFEWVDDWIEDGTSSNVAPRHGFVTDSDHSFFQSGLLLVTVVFNRVRNAWVPVLMAFLDGQDIDHHRPFFRYLFRQVRKRSGSRFNAELLIHVSVLAISNRVTLLFIDR